MGGNKRGKKKKPSKKNDSNDEKPNSPKGDSEPTPYKKKKENAMDTNGTKNNSPKAPPKMELNKRSSSEFEDTNPAQPKILKKASICDKDMEMEKDTLLVISKSKNKSTERTVHLVGKSDAITKEISQSADPESAEIPIPKDCKNNLITVDVPDSTSDIKSTADSTREVKNTVFGDTKKEDNAHFQISTLATENDKASKKTLNTVQNNNNTSIVKNENIAEEEKGSNSSNYQKANVSDKSKQETSVNEEKEETAKQGKNTGYAHTYVHGNTNTHYNTRSNQNKKDRPDKLDDDQLFKMPAEVSENFNKSGTLKLCFYVFLPLELWKKVIEDKSEVYVVSGAHRLGSWSQPWIHMKASLQLNCVVMYKGDSSVAKCWFPEESDYKYIIVSKFGDITWEIPQGAYGSLHRNRLLKIDRYLEEPKDADSYHFQFDDIFLPDETRNDGWMKSVFNLFSRKSSFREYWNKNNLKEIFKHSSFLIPSCQEQIMNLYSIPGLFNSFCNAFTRESGKPLPWVKLDAEVFYQRMNEILAQKYSVISNKSFALDDRIKEVIGVIGILCGLQHSNCNMDYVRYSLCQCISLENFSIDDIKNLFLYHFNEIYKDYQIIVLNGLHKFMDGLIGDLSTNNFKSTWCYPVVILHLLKESCSAGCDPDFPVNFNNTHEAKKNIFITYATRYDFHFIDSTMEDLESIKNSLLVDKLLQRSLVCLMKPKYFAVSMSGFFDEDLVLQRIIDFIKKQNCQYEKPIFAKSLSNLHAAICEDETNSSRISIFYYLLRLLRESLPNIHWSSNFACDYYLTLITILKILNEKLKDDNMKGNVDNSIKNKCIHEINEIATSVSHGKYNSLWFSKEEVLIEIKLFHEFMQLNLCAVTSDSKLQEEFYKQLCTVSEKAVNTWKKDIFIECYNALKIENYNTKMIEHFKILLLKIFKYKAENFDQKFFKSLIEGDNTSEFLLTHLREVWDGLQGLDDQIRWCANNVFMKLMFRYIGSFELECNPKLLAFAADVGTAMVDISNIVCEGEMNISNVKIICVNEKMFTDALQIAYKILKLETKDDRSLTHILDLCKIQLDNLKFSHEMLHFFVGLCKDFGCSKTGALESKLNQNINNLTLQNIFGDGESLATYYNLSEENLRILSNLYRNKVSGELFKYFWKKTQDKLDEDVEELNESQIINVILRPCLQEFKQMLSSCFDGSISSRDIKQIFGQLNEIENEMSKYLEYFKFSNSNLNLITRKIKCLLEFENKIRLAGEILMVADKLGMNGNFNAIVKINQILISDDVLLADIDDTMLKQSIMLDRVTPYMEKIFDAIASYLNFIVWVRQYVKDKFEVKKFLEFMTKAAETSYELQRVKCFETSCNAFTHIIFDLNETSGFVEFFVVCQQTCNLVKDHDDGKILDALADTNRSLEWFKRAQQSLGSVVETSFMKAQDINKNGCYMIGLTFDEYLKQTTTEDLVLHLTVKEPEETTNPSTSLLNDSTEKKENKKEYSLNGIIDLQSFLVLLGDNKVDQGKKWEKELFIQVCETMRKYASIYVKLIEAGYLEVLGFHYKEFQCDLKEAINQGLTELLRETTSEINTLNDEYEKWNQNIKLIREEHPLLNFFTVKQCVILQKFLYINANSMDQDVFIQQQALTLLRYIDTNICYDKVQKALLISYGKNNSRSSNKLSSSFQPDSNFAVYTLNEIEEVIEELQDYDIHEDIALASFSQIVPFDKNTAIQWCQVEAPSLEENALDELVENTRNEMETMDVASESDSSSSEESIEEDFQFLTFEELADFLEELKKLCSDDAVRESKLHYVNENKPSLLILTKTSIIPTAIHLYQDFNGRFPNPDQILLCNKNTGIEEIELIIQRSMFNKEDLFALLFIEELNYTTSQRVVTYLQAILNKGMSSQLILFCSSEKEFECLFVSSFNVYHIDLPFAIDNESLLQKFQNTLIENGRHYANLIISENGGMGKSLLIKQKTAELRRNIAVVSGMDLINFSDSLSTFVTVPIHGNEVDIEKVTELLTSSYEDYHKTNSQNIYHIDISPTISVGLDNFLFNLVVSGLIQNNNGVLWRRKNTDVIYIEMTFQKTSPILSSEVMLKLLPVQKCLSPKETAADTHGNGLNEMKFESDEFQRVYQYLKTYESGGDLNNFSFTPLVQGNPVDCLRILYKYCGLKDPSWMELNNFVQFFNQQLVDCEDNHFCNDAIQVNRETIQGFKSFVVKCCLEMSKDFSSRSIDTDDNTSTAHNDMVIIKRKWENSFHPYLFFNHDRSSFSFFGFNIDKYGNLTDPERSHEIVQHGFMLPNLYTGLSRQLEVERDYITFATNFNTIRKEIKLKLLCRVLGVEFHNNIDPDPSFVLTSDNVKKILAIHMKLRVNIPVIMSGETGCGKTKLVEYMCSLLASGRKNIRNMIKLKVHGGITYNDITKYIDKALELAKENKNKNIDTILFFDEANTTDAVGLIKEIMVDSRIQGKHIDLKRYGLQIIAALNPYRKHSEHMVKKLESAGLGYHIDEHSALEKLGKIPLRQLVYRVHKLPESLKYLVWDFGQLNAGIERSYIEKIAEKSGYYDDVFKNLIVNVLAVSQDFMRQQKDECSFVSLRDVHRAIQVMKWFDSKIDLLYVSLKLSRFEKRKLSVTLALSVCYISRLEKRDEYLKRVNKCFIGDYYWKGWLEIKKTIDDCQHYVVSQMKLKENIALNRALCENLFMMLVCIELRIPLFVVGKPGSSKSLAKTVIQDNMQGKLSKAPFFRDFKEIFMASYQCSILSTADGIISTFKQCSKYQEDKDLDSFTSVVVLDEVGLAEDSPRMPLKALHPLLEDGTDESEDLAIDKKPSENQRVAFIGLSNWSIDPAKMNRGIMLRHPIPDLDQLRKTARDICSGDEEIKHRIEKLWHSLSAAYLIIYNAQKKNEKLKQYRKEEFFGLRDFYSLVKMVFCFARQRHGLPEMSDIKEAVKRNFSGLNELDTWRIFKHNLKFCSMKETDKVDISSLDLIKKSLQKHCPCFDKRQKRDLNCEERCFNARYLLLMTKGYAALNIIEQILDSSQGNVDVIFGSSFPRDQEFTQVYRDITRIKMCMETGRSVILLNMENLYESLYDALNQYYVYFGGQRYVDLGLGTHRVKCRVHPDFKLIVIADVDTVYQTFPIPLINRLEKHFVLPSTCMQRKQLEVVEELSDWAHRFAFLSIQQNQGYEKISHSFPGYNESTCHAIVSKLTKNRPGEDSTNIFEEAKEMLLQTATPDSVIRFTESKNKEEVDQLIGLYFNDKQHFSLMSYLDALSTRNDSDVVFTQVTTFSRPLFEDEIKDDRIKLCHLMQFSTESSFRDALRDMMANQSQPNFIIIQCNNTSKQQNLIACAQHICMEMSSSLAQRNYSLSFVFLLQLNHSSLQLRGHQINWECLHIDELRESSIKSPSFIKYYQQPISELFSPNPSENTSREEMLQLLKSCIQNTVKDLNDEKGMSTEEITDKINILDMLLSQETSISHTFIDQLFRHLHSELQNKESLEDDGGWCSAWIRKKAREQNERMDYGTFHEALIHYVEVKVKPILSKFLISIDDNNNLLLLKRGKSKLWEELLKHQFYSLEMKKDTNDGGFNASFPFSNFIAYTVDNLKEAISHRDSIPDYITSMRKAVSKQFEVIEHLSEEQAKDYINDFLHLRINFHDERVYQLLTEILFYQIKFYLGELYGSDTLIDVPVIHILFQHEFERRLINATKIINMDISMIDKIAGAYDEREITIDMIALNQLLKSVWPDKGFFLLKDADWSFKLEKINPLVKTICAQVSNKDNHFGKLSLSIFKSCREKWSKLRILQLFVNTVIKSGNSWKVDDDDIVHEFWKATQTIDDNIVCIESWDKIKRIISALVNEVGDTSFQDRCIAFYVEFVSEFCFARDDFLDVDPSVIETLMSYVFNPATNTTKLFSPIEEYGVDKTTVVRSFILKQLLKREEKQRLKGIESCLNAHLKLVPAENNLQFWEICKMFVYCYEDHTAAKYVRCQGYSKVFIDVIIQLLENGMESIKGNKFEKITASVLKTTAEMRYCFINACDLLYKRYVEKVETNEDVDRCLVKLYSVVEKCIKENEVHFFCLRFIFKSYGSKELEMIIEESGFDWLKLQQNQKSDFDDCDKFLVYGEEYQQFRDSLLQNIINKSTIADFKQEHNDVPAVICKLSVVRELVLSNVSIDENMFNEICHLFQVEAIIEFVRDGLNSMNDQMLMELLIHLNVVLSESTNNGSTQLLQILLHQPKEIKNLYLPTMPSDNFAEVASAGNGNGAWVMHACPNGHPYVITECGRALQQSSCNVCNAPIGAQSEHVLLSNNRLLQQRDTTQQGYCLGLPDERPQSGSPERNLSNLSVVIQRFLMHLSMLLSPRVISEDMQSAITNPRGTANIKRFLQQHIEVDLKLIGKLLCKNSNDVILSLHLLLSHLQSQQWETKANIFANLQSKNGRNQYENWYHDNVIAPFIVALDASLDVAKPLTLNDSHGSTDPVFRKLHKLDVEEVQDIVNIDLMQNWHLWEYQVPISINHFNLYIQRICQEEKLPAFKCLQNFLTKENQWQYVRQLPNLLKLQKILFSNFNYRLDSDTMLKMKISDVKKELSGADKEQISKLITLHCNIWNELAASLKERYGVYLADEEKRLGSKSSLGYFLASDTGRGRCALALIDYLASLQQGFLQDYLSSTNQKQKFGKGVSLVEVEESDLICYSREENLIPLLYANCTYALEIGSNTVTGYDVASIEKQLLEKLCFGSNLLIIQIDRFVYRDSVRTSKTFVTLAKAIAQESIESSEQQAILRGFTGISELTNALNAIETAIGFLSITHGKPEMSYAKYIEDVLRMDVNTHIESPRMQKSICLKHISAAWLMLTVERAKRLHSAKQVPFKIDEIFCKEIDENEVNSIKSKIQHLNINALLDLLTEYICYELQFRKDIPEYPLMEALETYEDTRSKQIKIVGEDLMELPIELAHIFSFWKLVAELAESVSKL